MTRASALALVALFPMACNAAPRTAPATSASPSISLSAPAATDPGDTCRERIAALLAQPDLGGAAAFERTRVELLGRARGEPLVLVREPALTPDASLPPAWLTSRRAFEHGHPGRRIAELRARHRNDPRALRTLVLREGYLYTADPLDALGLVSSLHVSDLFDEPEVWLERGSARWRLERDGAPGRRTYKIAEGAGAGQVAELLFGDRLAVSPEELAQPLHRDVRALAESAGFDRATVRHYGTDALVVDLRFGDHWARALLEADGAVLKVGCMAEDAATRASIDTVVEQARTRREALARLRTAVGAEVDEALRFDRPEGEKTAEHDGELRPLWNLAYHHGQRAFGSGDTWLPVFDPQGRPWPPQVCVDFVLDSYERAAGTWFSPRGETPMRVRGLLDFDTLGISNRHGVLAFGRFAADHSELFDVVSFEGDERIPFRDRSRFFAFLVDHAGVVRAGDVVAIQGLKADGHIHQHAILVEHTDPLTGFPYGLADQMSRPRRRTWEGIMAEAPLRSLLFRARPTDRVLGAYGASVATSQ